MRCFEIMQQGRNRQTVYRLCGDMSIDAEVHNRHKRICVDSLLIADLTYSLIAKAHANAECTEHLKDAVVIAYNADHLIVSLVHL